MNLIEVVGKNFKRVPILLTKSMTSAFEALIDKRDDGGVSSSNPYVFAQVKYINSYVFLMVTVSYWQYKYI